MSADTFGLWLHNRGLINHLSDELLQSMQNEIIECIGGFRTVINLCLKDRYNINLIKHQNLLQLLSIYKSENEGNSSILILDLHDICISNIFTYLDQKSQISLQKTCRNMVIIGRRKESFIRTKIRKYKSFATHLKVEHQLNHIIPNIKSQNIQHQKNGILNLSKLFKSPNDQQRIILKHSGLEPYLLNTCKQCISRPYYGYDVIGNIFDIVLRNNVVKNQDLINYGILQLFTKYVFRSGKIGLITVCMGALHNGLYSRFEALWNEHNLFAEIIKAVRKYNTVSMKYVFPLIQRILRSNSFNWNDKLTQRLTNGKLAINSFEILQSDRILCFAWKMIENRNSMNVDASGQQLTEELRLMDNIMLPHRQSSVSLPLKTNINWNILSSDAGKLPANENLFNCSKLRTPRIIKEKQPISISFGGPKTQLKAVPKVIRMIYLDAIDLTGQVSPYGSDFVGDEMMLQLPCNDINNIHENQQITFSSITNNVCSTGLVSIVWERSYVEKGYTHIKHLFERENNLHPHLFFEGFNTSCMIQLGIKNVSNKVSKHLTLIEEMYDNSYLKILFQIGLRQLLHIFSDKSICNQSIQQLCDKLLILRTILMTRSASPNGIWDEKSKSIILKR